MTRGNSAYRIDLHVHTGRYSQCAEAVDPYRIEEYALRAGLDGVVITEHDIFWQDEEIELLRAAASAIRVFRGIEVSARGCHLVVIGIDDAGPLVHGATMEDVVAYANRQEAAVILAHPYRDSRPEGLPSHMVHAVEVASTSFTAEEAIGARDLALALGLPAVAASDAHALSRIGWAWTELPVLPDDEAGLAEAIRSGLGRPVAPNRLPS